MTEIDVLHELIDDLLNENTRLRARLDRQGGAPALTAGDIEEISRMRQSGWGTTELAQHFGVCKSTIWRASRIQVTVTRAGRSVTLRSAA